jgi:hypothetical protein
MATIIDNKDLQQNVFREGGLHDAAPVTFRPNRAVLPIAAVPVTPVQNPVATTKSQLSSAIAAPSDAANEIVFRGTWKNFIPYNINDAVLFNGSLYLALLGNTNLQPDNNHDAGPAEGSLIGTAVWTLLAENLVFSASTPNVLTTGGFGPYDTGVITQGSGTSFSVTGTPSATAEIALLTIVESNGGNSVASGLSGWTFLTNRGGQWSYYYKVLTSAAQVTAAGTLSISDDWIAALDFFKFGGFASVSASQVTVNASNQITILVGNSSGLLVAGQQVAFSGFVGASFLNGFTMNISTANATQITGTIGPGHANYGPTADSGTVSLILQQISSETSGALFPPANTVFANASRVGNVFIWTAVAGGIFAGGGNLSGYSDSNGNSYVSTFALNTTGGAHFTLNQAYSSPNKVGGNIVTITVAGGSDLTGAGSGAMELAGSASVPQYGPFDVVQFRGSMFVCLTETTNDAFQQPSAWGLIGPGVGYVDQLSGDYSAVATDSGRLLSMNSSSNHTITLPNPVPAPAAGTFETGWMIFVQNIGTGTLTIARNGLTIDGAAANLTLGQNQGLVIFADPTGNYETMHGMNSLIMPNIFTVTVPNGSGQVTIGLATQSANTFWRGPTSGGAATPTFGLIVNADLPVTTPTVPPEFSVSGNVASPAGSLAISKVSEPANMFWGSPDGVSGVPIFRKIVSNDVPPPSQLAIVEVQGTFQTGTVTGVLRLPGNVIPPKGIYRVTVYLEMAANPGAGNLDAQIGWTSLVQARTASNGANGLPADVNTAALNYSTGRIEIVSDGIHDITFTLTLT